MRKLTTACCVALAALLLTIRAAHAQRPNVLWILTDDQRYDSIGAFNRILRDRDHSELGYVESPNVDRLAAMGTTFINTYCQAPGCAPSRASMHYGRYPVSLCYDAIFYPPTVPCDVHNPTFPPPCSADRYRRHPDRYACIDRPGVE